MLKQKRFWIGVLISVALLIFLLRQTDWAALGEAFRNANYLYLIPALGLYFIGVGLRAARWHYLLLSIKPVPVRHLFPVVVIGYMANDLLPARIGELVRAYLLGESEHISKASILVTIFLERLFDGLTMIAFIAGASLFLALNAYLQTLLAIGSILFIGMVIVLVLVAGFRERLDHVIHWIISHLPAHWGERGAKLIHSFLHGLNVLRNPGHALAAFLLSIIAWLFEAGMYLVLAQGFGLVQSFPVFVLATAVANIVTIVPSTPGYVGVFDAPIVGILTLFGADRNVALSYTFLLHAALIAPVVLLGLVFIWHAGLNLGQLSRRTDVSIETTS